MEDASPVNFNSVRSMWMARDKPTGPKKIGQPPEDFKTNRVSNSESAEVGSERSQQFEKGTPDSDQAASARTQELDTDNSEPQLPRFPIIDSANDGGRERGGRGHDSETVSAIEDEDCSLPQATLGMPLATAESTFAAMENEALISDPISDDTTKELLLQLPDISESASEDGDRSLSSPGSDMPIQRATGESLHGDSAVSPRDDHNVSQPFQGHSRQHQTGTVLHEVVKGAVELVDDLQNAKAVETRLHITDFRAQGSLGESQSMPSPRSQVTTVDISHHQQVVESLHKKITALNHELDTIKTERDVEKLVNLPSQDSSPLIAEMQSQLVHKDKKLRVLEKENADHKRNYMIQAVELQELSDHVQGLEKQKASMEKHTFPSLPPLQIVREAAEEGGEEMNHLRMATLANAALRSAEEEIAVLKKGEHRRQQLEMMLEHAKLKISSLEVKQRPPGSSSQSQVGRMWNETKRSGDDGMAGQAAELGRQLDESRGEVAALQALVAELNKSHGIAVAVSEEAQALLAQKSQEGEQALKALERQAEHHPDGGAKTRSCQTDAIDEELAYAVEILQSKLAEACKDMAEMRRLAGQGADVLQVMEECLAHVDPLVSLLDQRSDLSVILRCIASRTESLLATCAASELPSDDGAKPTLREKPDAGRAVRGSGMSAAGRSGRGDDDPHGSRLKELERSERFLKEELENASTALAKARTQNNALSIELNIMRKQLEGVTDRAPGARSDDELRVRVQQLERERDQLIRCLEDLNRTVPAKVVPETTDESASRLEVERVLEEKQELESTVVELRQIREALQVENQEARSLLVEAQRENRELEQALQGARAKIAEEHEELVLKKKEITTLSRHLKAVSAALEATNAEVQQQPTRTSLEHGSPPSVTSENETLWRRELSMAQEEIRALQEKIVEYQQNQEDVMTTAERVRSELSLSKQNVSELREKVMEQEELLLHERAQPEGWEDELGMARRENASLRAKVEEMEKQMELKKQKLAVLAEYKMRMVKQHGELSIDDT